jgi:hypothetical protein
MNMHNIYRQNLDTIIERANLITNLLNEYISLPFQNRNALNIQSIQTELIETLNQFDEIETERVRPTLMPLLTKHYLKNMSISLIYPDSDEQALIEYDCAICLEKHIHHICVESNCGHIMCSDCTQNYCKSIKDKTTKPTCPMCRCEFTQFIANDEYVLESLKNCINNL